MNRITRDSTRLEEIDHLRDFADSCEDGTWLHSLMTEGLVDWVAEQIMKGHLPILHELYTSGSRKLEDSIRESVALKKELLDRTSNLLVLVAAKTELQKRTNAEIEEAAEVTGERIYALKQEIKERCAHIEDLETLLENWKRRHLNMATRLRSIEYVLRYMKDPQP